MTKYTIQQIADRIGGKLLGAGDAVISGVDQLDTAGPGQITFIRDRAHAKNWSRSRATAALVTKELHLLPPANGALVEVEDADLAMAAVLELFAPPAPVVETGIASSAVIASSAQIHPSAAVGHGCVIGEDVRIAEGCTLHANVTILDGSELGAKCVLFPGVVIYDRCKLGQGVIIHANSVIGADGFGYRPGSDASGSLVKIPQIGTVVIGDDVEIGSGTCIDRGKFSATTIGDGTKIDNNCQIAHNCRIGRHCILAAQVGLAGSVTIGDRAVLAGKAAVVDHVTVGAGARLAGRATAMKNVPEGATWYGHPGRDIQFALRQIAALHKLPGLLKKLRKQVKMQTDP